MHACIYIYIYIHYVFNVPMCIVIFFCVCVHSYFFVCFKCVYTIFLNIFVDCIFHFVFTHVYIYIYID